MEPAPSAKSVASERLYVAIAAAICVASLVVGLVVAQQRQVGNFGVETDFYGQHMEEAENLRLGRTYSSHLHPPGYAAILAIARMAGVDYFAGAKTLTAVSTALLCWLVFLLIRGLFDARVAAGATLLLALLLIPFSVLASTDVLATMLAFAAIWVLFRSEEVTPRTCFVAGALAGGACHGPLHEPVRCDRSGSGSVPVRMASAASGHREVGMVRGGLPFDHVALARDQLAVERLSV